MSTPEDDEAYQRFMESMTERCRCTPEGNRPCDGVLAGGLCDDMHPDLETQPKWATPLLPSHPKPGPPRNAREIRAFRAFQSFRCNLPGASIPAPVDGEGLELHSSILRTPP